MLSIVNLLLDIQQILPNLLKLGEDSNGFVVGEEFN